MTRAPWLKRRTNQAIEGRGAGYYAPTKNQDDLGGKEVCVGFGDAAGLGVERRSLWWRMRRAYLPRRWTRETVAEEASCAAGLGVVFGLVVGLDECTCSRSCHVSMGLNGTKF